jgi:hypothetical protein
VLTVRIVEAAQRHIAVALDQSEAVWNQRDRMEALVYQAISDLAENPRRRHANLRRIGHRGPMLIVYHLKWSSENVPAGIGSIREPPYYLIARVDADTLKVLALKHHNSLSDRALRAAQRLDRST